MAARQARLIVLDSCEHVIGTAAGLAEAGLKTAPSVHSLAISREPLRAEGEWLHRLASLEVPPFSSNIASDDPLRYRAVQLFVGPSHGDRGHGGGTWAILRAVSTRVPFGFEGRYWRDRFPRRQKSRVGHRRNR
jgi:hypothetical protein